MPNQLNRLIFVLNNVRSSYMQAIAADIESVRKRLESKNVTVCRQSAADWEARADGGVPAGEREQTLYITDDGRILERMLAGGIYAIALYHEYNRREELSKALYAMEDIGAMEFDSFLKAYERLAGLPWHIADTARLVLRETTVADVEEFYRIYQNPAITRHMDALYQNIDEEKKYAADYIKKIYGFYGYGIWTVLLRETGEVIGRAGISWREGFRYPELGFVIAAEHQRQGYGEEICREILKFVKQELEYETVQVLVEPGNIPSLNLCRKLGFTFQERVLIQEKEHMLLFKRIA